MSALLGKTLYQIILYLFFKNDNRSIVMKFEPAGSKSLQDILYNNPEWRDNYCPRSCNPLWCNCCIKEMTNNNQVIGRFRMQHPNIENLVFQPAYVTNSRKKHYYKNKTKI